MCVKQDKTVGDKETWALSWNCLDSRNCLTSFYYGIQVIMKNDKTTGQKDLGGQTLSLSCTSCVNVGKSLNFSDPLKK